MTPEEITAIFTSKHLLKTFGDKVAEIFGLAKSIGNFGGYYVQVSESVQDLSQLLNLEVFSMLARNGLGSNLLRRTSCEPTARVRMVTNNPYM